jgi:hypothetical protein
MMHFSSMFYFMYLTAQCRASQLEAYTLGQGIPNFYSLLKAKAVPPQGACGERRYSSYIFLTLALGTPGTHCTGVWVGPRAGLETKARG